MDGIGWLVLILKSNLFPPHIYLLPDKYTHYSWVSSGNGYPPTGIFYKLPAILRLSFWSFWLILLISVSISVSFLPKISFLAKITTLVPSASLVRLFLKASANLRLIWFRTTALVEIFLEIIIPIFFSLSASFSSTQPNRGDCRTRPFSLTVSNSFLFLSLFSFFNTPYFSLFPGIRHRQYLPASGPSSFNHILSVLGRHSF